MIYVDRSLSQRLERTEGRASASFVEAHAQMAPELGVEWTEVAGTYAMFDGLDSPLSQTFGLGMFDEITDRELDAIEAFFHRHGATVYHEVSPLAGLPLINLLNQRGYQPCELTNVMFREIGPALSFTPLRNTDVAAQLIEPGEAELWAQTAAAGWATEGEGLAEFMLAFGRICAITKGGFPFVAELGGRAISAGMLYIFDDVALLGGASTVPDGRRQGGQSALLVARLRFAAEHGCRLAMMGALPGSQSQRNAETNGFRIAYTRIKWQLTGRRGG